jgi:gas vesicle protein
MNDNTPQRTTHLTAYAALTSFVVGGIAGATAALLFAPQSGQATRQLVGRKLNEAAGSARDFKDRAVRRGQDFRGEATSRVQGAASALAGKTGERGNGDIKGDSPAV